MYLKEESGNRDAVFTGVICINTSFITGLGIHQVKNLGKALFFGVTGVAFAKGICKLISQGNLPFIISDSQSEYNHKITSAGACCFGKLVVARTEFNRHHIGISKASGPSYL